MRNHTAEHILVSQLKRIRPDLQLGYIWIDAEQGTVDMKGDFDSATIFTAEKQTQEIIFRDLPVRSSMVPASSLSESIRAREGLSAKYNRLRIISIEGVDDAACSGIHVLSTGEIGFFKVTDFKVIGDATRIQFLTHLRAAHHVQDIYNEILSRKASYPYEMSQIGPVLDKSKRVLIQQQEMKELITSLLADYEKAVNVAGVRFVNHYLPGFDAKDLRNTLKGLPSKRNSATLLFAPGNKSSFVLWTHGLPHDALFYAKEITEKLGGRGGGSKESFTGGFASVSNPREVFEKLVKGICDKLKSG